MWMCNVTHLNGKCARPIQLRLPLLCVSAVALWTLVLLILLEPGVALFLLLVGQWRTAPLWHSINVLSVFMQLFV